jgi:predicted hydrocarbon binding protein
MHGVIFLELKKYTESKLGAGAWATLLEKAGLAGNAYYPTTSYPDSDAIALVVAASKITGLEVPVILEDFGAFIVPGLLGMYKNLIKPEWKTLELLENTEAVIHTVVRLRNPGAEPPELECKRSRPNEVTVVYQSKRKMCALAKGIIRGVGNTFKEKLTIQESSCMHNGADRCLIHVSVPA